MDDRFAELLSRKLSGEATPEEIRELHDYLQTNAGDQYFAELLATYWNASQDATNKLIAEDDEHFEHILLLAGQPPVVDTPNTTEEEMLPGISQRRSWPKWLAAASVLVIAATGAVLFFKPQPSVKIIPKIEPEKNEIIAKRGARSHLLLPDGSQVWLNSDSKLSYSNFNDALREVELEGEAFFDVVKQSKRPFIVHTSGIAIHVLGTAFNVKSYAEESFIETTLIRGLIEVEKNDQPNGERIVVLPHNKLVFDKQKNSIIKSSAAIKVAPDEIRQQQSGISLIPLPKNKADSNLKEISWVYNRLSVDGDSFRELSDKLERWFNIKITLKSEQLANMRVHGIFENETIQGVMEALKTMNSITYKINDDNNVVEIYKK